jgi:hypothetical protein
MITFITTGLIYPRFVSELKSKLSKEEYEQLSPRIKFVHRFRVDDEWAHIKFFSVINVAASEIDPFEPLKEFAPAFSALCNSEPIACKSSGKVFSGLPLPAVAIVDVCAPLYILHRFTLTSLAAFCTICF